ncbi:predicted protein [Sclerotinia sclerotiorum 1980 UF-70]|uniref:Uncharacterized protein n=1 Tax=Sclerotinia sclerotiorum (strain ATCC 18683 / 1980 / Ss-1) TaxID=665079 RepID=A7EBP0_SCLS1|nr:predicted protein [Sclerotinia sclerotiorum 1980 UF-70]EDN99868.1 predicted protein [Sclerotinia sclerotiorum 1980 UF-70]
MDLLILGVGEMIFIFISFEIRSSKVDFEIEIEIVICGVVDAWGLYDLYDFWTLLIVHYNVLCDQKGVYRPAIVFNLKSTGEEHL